MRSTIIGITGGISTGKSTFSKMLREKTGAETFDADVAARALVERDDEVRKLLRAEFGDAIFSATGDLNRAALRAIILADPKKKRALEQVLHPRIRLQWAAEADRNRRAGKIFLADIPLLYETAGEKLCDTVVVVACSPMIQETRLTNRTSMPLREARALIAAQMPLEKKIARAGHVAWNNGPREALAAQAEICARFLHIV
jgi:dephospho-CoA kinase